MADSILEVLQRAERYADVRGDLREFKSLYAMFRASSGIEDSAKKSIAYLYGKRSVDAAISDVPARSCGECVICCTGVYDHTVPTPSGDFNVGGAAHCPNLTDHQEFRCAIYADRPKQCSRFRCVWLDTPEWPDSMRPDRSGVIVAYDPAIPAEIRGRKVFASYMPFATEEANRYAEQYAADRKIILRKKITLHPVSPDVNTGK